MGLLHYLFGLSGRINRAKQWAVLLVSLVHATIIAFLFSFTIGYVTIADLVQKKVTLTEVVHSPQARAFAIIFCVLYAIGFYIGIAVVTKRLHDRDKAAWWLLIFIALPLALNIPQFLHLPVLIEYFEAAMKAGEANLPPPPPPIEPPLVILSRGAATIISLWAFVELYILKGTEGPNRFGPDPLAGRA